MTIIDTITTYTNIVHDFPRPGNTHFDFSKLKAHAAGLDVITQAAKNDILEWSPDIIIGHADRRDFIAAVAAKTGIGYALVHHRNDIIPGPKFLDKDLMVSSEVMNSAKKSDGSLRVVIVDEVIISGRDAISITELVKQAGGEVVNSVFLIELSEIGRQALTKKQIPMTSLSTYINGELASGIKTEFPDDASRFHGKQLPLDHRL